MNSHEPETHSILKNYLFSSRSALSGSYEALPRSAHSCWRGERQCRVNHGHIDLFGVWRRCIIFHQGHQRLRRVLYSAVGFYVVLVVRAVPTLLGRSYELEPIWFRGDIMTALKEQAIVFLV